MCLSRCKTAKASWGGWRPRGPPRCLRRICWMVRRMNERPCAIYGHTHTRALFRTNLTSIHPSIHGTYRGRQDRHGDAGADGRGARGGEPFPGRGPLQLLHGAGAACSVLSVSRGGRNVRTPVPPFLNSPHATPHTFASPPATIHTQIKTNPITTHTPTKKIPQVAPRGLFLARVYSGFAPPRNAETATGLTRRPLTLLESAGACVETDVVRGCTTCLGWLGPSFFEKKDDVINALPVVLCTDPAGAQPVLCPSRGTESAFPSEAIHRFGYSDAGGFVPFFQRKVMLASLLFNN